MLEGDLIIKTMEEDLARRCGGLRHFEQYTSFLDELTTIDAEGHFIIGANTIRPGTIKRC